MAIKTLIEAVCWRWHVLALSAIAGAMARHAACRYEMRVHWRWRLAPRVKRRSIRPFDTLSFFAAVAAVKEEATTTEWPQKRMISYQLLQSFRHGIVTRCPCAALEASLPLYSCFVHRARGAAASSSASSARAWLHAAGDGEQIAAKKLARASSFHCLLYSRIGSALIIQREALSVDFGDEKGFTTLATARSRCRRQSIRMLESYAY